MAKAGRIRLCTWSGVSQAMARVSSLGRSRPPGDLTPEDQGDHRLIHVLVGPGELDRLDCQSGLLADFALWAVLVGFGDFQDAAAGGVWILELGRPWPGTAVDVE